MLIDLEFIRKENGIEMDTDEFAIDGAYDYFACLGLMLRKQNTMIYDVP